jgi:hypothetical protein
VNKNEKLSQILRFLQSRGPAMERLLKRFVRCESPTDDKGAVDRLAHAVATEWRKRRAKVKYLTRREAGNHLRITWPAGARHGAGTSTGGILVLDREFSI